ncbi:MAG: hypothetical protein HEQ39_05510 [Rhizobacter sp.]
MKFNDYIIAHADKGVSDENFLRTFGQEEVFFSIDEPDTQLKDGPLEASPGADVRLQLAKLDIGPMALFYASRGDRRLSQRFAGMPLIRAAQMICATPEVEGLLIQSDADAWLVVRKDALHQVVGQIRA